MPNQLIKEKSLYLQQHAHNPVDWHPWNEATISKAEKLNKPLLISIGYSSCHWCHVMEKESFENSDVATLMNEVFVCIKVDREELPDVDQYYMNAVHSLGKQGGWPLNIVALPSGQFVWGATYFPKEQWMNIIEQWRLLYKKGYDRILEQANEIEKRLKNVSYSKQGAHNLFSEIMIKERLISSADLQNGGLKGVPKFPMPSFLLLIQELNYFSPDDRWKYFLEVSVNKMASGGLYDCVGGGFARYAVDGQWRIPHFEKMLYDNAQLLEVYSNTQLISHNNKFNQLINDTIGFLWREMKHPDGGFYSSIDADSKEEEGRFYYWTKEEIFYIFPNEEAILLMDYFDFNEKSYWELDRYVLNSQDDIAFAHQRNIDPDVWAEQKKKFLQRLFLMREKRERPRIDKKRITSWNALLVRGLLAAYRATSNPLAMDAAKHAMAYIDEQSSEKGWEIRHSDTRSEVFLEDYALTIRAFLDWYEFFGERNRLIQAEALFREALQKFADKDGSLWFESVEESLIPVRLKSRTDQVIPSSNAVMAELLLRFALFTDNSKYRKLADSMLNTIISEAMQYPDAYCYWIRLLMWRSRGVFTLSFLGDRAEDERKAFLSHFHPATFISYKMDENVKKNEESAISHKSEIHWCGEGFCMPPYKTTTELLDEIGKYRQNQSLI